MLVNIQGMSNSSPLLATANHFSSKPETSEPASKQPGKTPNKAADHKNEGFLKSTWHKLTQQHDNLEQDQETANKENAGKEEEEPTKRAGSG